MEGSNFKAPRVDFIDLIDRKVEKLHIEYAGKSTPAQLHMDANVAIIDAHTDDDEDDYAVE